MVKNVKKNVIYSVYVAYSHSVNVAKLRVSFSIERMLSTLARKSIMINDIFIMLDE